MKRVIAFIIRYVYAAGSCVYLFTFGFLFDRNRSLISMICAHFGYGREIRTIIPEVELSEIVPEDILIQIRDPIKGIGNVTPAEIIAIVQAIRFHNPHRLFEIGTFDGRTTLNMAANSSDEAEIYTLDLPREQMDSTKLPIVPTERIYIDKETSGSKYSGKDCEGKITQLYGDSATFDFSPFLNNMDFIFVDGSHSYEYAMNDSEKALKLLRDERGMVLWHDYGNWEGVTVALNELYSEVSEFVDLRHIKGTSLVCLTIG